MRRIHAVVLRIVLCLLCILLLTGAAGADTVFHPADEATARRQAMNLFFQCAFHPEYGYQEENVLNRWEEDITIWIGGSATPEDRRTVDAFLAELQEKVPNLPSVRRVQRDTDAAVRIWYVPQYMLKYYLEDYVEGNWGFFSYRCTRNRITSARIGISSDITDQEERNHLVLEELVGSLGLPGDHEVYADSILYDPWTVVQSLSEVDWRMLNLLYDPALSAGMRESQVRAVLEGVPE